MPNIVKVVFVVIVVVFILLFASNPNSPKDYARWMFESEDNHAVLPDLSNEEIEKVNNEDSQLKKESDVLQEKVLNE